MSGTIGNVYPGNPPAPLSLFSAADVQTLRQDRLMGVARRYFPKLGLSDSYLLGKLQAEESRLQHNLRIFLTPREVVPDGTPQAAIDALTAAGNQVEIEPGYDYDPSFFQGNTWGLIELRQRQIQVIHSITFNYPSPADVLYQIPNEWIRAERKYGRVNLVPVQTTFSLPLNAFLLQALGGGNLVPLMLQVAYRCGLANARADYPELVDLLFKRAALSILDDQYLPQSMSSSVDGLSQSLSFAADKQRDELDAREERLRTRLNGIQMSAF